MHFDIHLDRADRTKNRVLLDGTDITTKILASGFSLEVNDAGHPIVNMRLKPNSVDIDGQLFVNEAPPGEVCRCGHIKRCHSGRREDDFTCEFVDQCRCNGWEPSA